MHSVALSSLRSRVSPNFLRHTLRSFATKLDAAAYKDQNDTWVDRYAPKAMQPYLKLIRIDRPVGMYRTPHRIFLLIGFRDLVAPVAVLLERRARHTRWSLAVGSIAWKVW